jgi:hypothetical protein
VPEITIEAEFARAALNTGWRMAAFRDCRLDDEGPSDGPATRLRRLNSRDWRKFLLVKVGCSAGRDVVYFILWFEVGSAVLELKRHIAQHAN